MSKENPRTGIYEDIADEVNSKTESILNFKVPFVTEEQVEAVCKVYHNILLDLEVIPSTKDTESLTESLDDVMLSVLRVKGIDLDNLSRSISDIDGIIYRYEKHIRKELGLENSKKFSNRVVLTFLRICLEKLADEAMLVDEEGGY